MNSTPRRAFLVSVGAVSLTGCTDFGSSDEPAADATTGDVTATPDETLTPTNTATATSTPPPAHADYETTEVRVRTPDGDELGSVIAAIADTPELRYLGLSDTEYLPEDHGMLFVYDSVGRRTFVMREMDFGIDIVFADEEGTITEIHHAPAPGPDEDGSEQHYPGYGKYVLEVVYEWTTKHGVEEGDVLEFDL